MFDLEKHKEALRLLYLATCLASDSLDDDARCDRIYELQRRVNEWIAKWG